MNGHQKISLGDVLKIEQDEVLLEPNETYRTAGIYSFGRGVFERQPILGADTSYTSLFRLHENQFILSRLNGWEGAVDVVSAELDGCLVSNEYPTFAIDSDLAYPGYLRWITRWPRFWEQLIPRGSMVRRKRVKPAQLLDVEIPLPPTDDQRRIADELDSVRQHASATIDAQLSAPWFDKAVVDAAIWRIIERGIASGWSLRTLGDIAEINPRPNYLDPDESVSFVPMAAVDQYMGSIESSAEVRRVETIGPGYKQFKRGDIIFARITPCMQNGKTAIFDGITDYSYGSTEFHVIRPGSKVRAEWLHRFLRTQEFRNLAAQRLTGTAGQQRVPAEFLRTADIPIPPESEQDKVLLAIDRLLERGSSLALSRAKASALAAAIEPAIINQVFA